MSTTSQGVARATRRRIGARWAAVLATVFAASLSLAAPPVSAAEATSPTPPAGIRAVAYDGRVELSWSYAGTTRDRPITHYVITEVLSGKKKVVPYLHPRPLTYTWSELPNDVPVQFTVQGRSSGGTSAPSPPSEVVVPQPQLLVDGPDGTESELAGGAVFTVYLTGVRPYDVTARLRTLPPAAQEAATPGEDYLPFDTTVTIAAGETVATVPLTVLDDDESEGFERVGAELTSERPLTKAYGEAGIGDDEEHVVARLTAPEQVDEGGESTSDLGIVLELSKPLDVATTLMPVVTVTEARSGKQLPTLLHLATPVTPLVVPAGEMSVPVPLAVRDDAMPEKDVAVTVSLAGTLGPGDYVDPSPVRVVVIDDDTAAPTGPNLALTASPAPKKSAQGHIEVQLPASGTWPLTVRNRSGQGADFPFEVLVTVTPWTRSATPPTVPAGCTTVAASTLVEPATWTWRCAVPGLKDKSSKAVVPITLAHASDGEIVAEVEAVVVWNGMRDPKPANNVLRTLLRAPRS